MPNVFKEQKDQSSAQKGYMLIILLVFSGIFVTLLTASAAYVVSDAKATGFKVNQQKILEIAEAGIDYYRWHLAHVPDDYTDGTGEAGPYLHDYKDINGNIIGQFSLNIIPPETGTTIVTIESTGYLLTLPDITRTAMVKMGIPSFANYAVVANDKMRFGEGTEVWGLVHSNDGIRFDGLAHNLITSAKWRYNDPDHSGQDEFGVHTHIPPIDPIPPPNPPADIPSRPDVFAAGREFPVPAIDFDGITADLAELKDLAIENGIYLTESDEQGYHVNFNPDGTVDITMVTSLQNCSWRWFGWWRDYTDTWSIGAEIFFTYEGQSSQGLPMPANGIIFIQDDIWVDGQINGSQVTVVAAKDPLASKKGSIYLNNDLKYTSLEGNDIIGLIAADNISVGFYSEDDLEIDAALIAQNGRVGRYYYANRSGYQQNPPNCASNVYRNQISVYGSIATNQRYGFAYTDGTGYQIRNLNFDPNLIYFPPPHFPTTGEYTIISWEER